MDAVLGIDIGKAKFHVTLRFGDGTRRRKACANSPRGCAELLTWMARHGAGRVHACLEATGPTVSCWPPRWWTPGIR